MVKVKEEILRILYNASKDSPVEMTIGEMFWKTDDPSISEQQIKEASEALIKERKLSKYLSKYSLDKITFLEIKENNEEDTKVKVKPKKTVPFSEIKESNVEETKVGVTPPKKVPFSVIKERNEKDIKVKEDPKELISKISSEKIKTPKKVLKKTKEVPDKQTSLSHYKDKSYDTNSNKFFVNMVTYLFIVLVTFMFSYFFFNRIDSSNIKLLGQTQVVNNDIKLQDIAISKTRFANNPANEVAYAMQLEAKNNKEIVTLVNQLRNENEADRNALNGAIKIINEKQNEIMDYQNKVNIALVVTLFLTFLILILNRNKS